MTTTIRPQGLILIIDDSVANILVLTKLLALQADIIFATDGQDGLQKAYSQRPDLILLDVSMPDMDGYQVCQQLKANPRTKDCPIIFITSHEGDEHEVKALAAGGVDFIRKPFNPPIVSARVQTQLAMRKALYELSLAKEQAEQASRAKSEFIATVSHELRTPLTSISGGLSLVLGKLSDTLSPKAKLLLETASRNSERLTLLINDILDIERIELGQLTFDFQTIDLVQLVQQAIVANQGYALKHHVQLTITHLPSSPAWVMANSHRLLQVFANLLSNAIKYSPPQGLVELSLVEVENAWRVTVKDYGRGIPSHFKTQIFQRFAQADSSDTREQGGTGLGLSISKAIIERHQGVIGYCSEEGQGSAFYFDLPLLAIENTPVVQPTANAQSQLPHILHVEDDIDLIHISHALLEDIADYSYAHSLQQAKDKLANQHYDLVILDINLPDGSGLSLLAALTNTPIMLFTEQDNHMTTHENVSSVLIKSKTSNEEFVAMVKKLLAITP
ncbi:response regulator [Agitococcus lubricus]|uniref:histidine kinase n=1 Tax=Agitococcus lubricus TaxID=1077255 RepID=A0A2T5J432_9GAMM|nr:response regulator [Agitococcus lubricus]PTQ91361.1 response regulator receiver domain-containing protein [Agitococcus lubricus]